MSGVDAIKLAAWEAHRAGLCVVPPREDGSKRPEGAQWTTYQGRLSTLDELHGWYSNGRQGVGVVTGKVSGNLETFEFDDRETYDAFIDAANASGLGELIARIIAGYEEESPGAGIHWPMYCEQIAGNTTLARRPLPDGTRKSLIQTRGEGGYIVLAPSGGRVHPTGRSYRLRSGALGTIARVTPEERAALWRLARTFDEMPATESASSSAGRATTSATGTRPGDDFAARTDWSAILEPHGWVRVHSRGDKILWRRPGKDSGISATTNYAGSDYLYVFSSSTVFDPERGYSKFSAYAILNHGGDFAAAAGELARQGYGEKRETQFAKLGSGKVDPATVETIPEANRTPPTLDADERHLPLIVPLAWAALVAANDPPRLFSFGGLPTRFRWDIDGHPQTEVLTEDRLHFEIARAANWAAARKGGPILVSPPMLIVKHMLANPAPPLPPLDAIVAAPNFAADGTVQTEPGYHPASRAYYAPANGFAVPGISDNPSDAEVRRAVALIADDLLGDFPFVGDSERAHAIGLLILPFVRALISGPTPLHLIEKPMAGTGATLLADMLLYPATGQELSALTEGKDDDEWRKRITARLRAAPVAVLIDNLKHRLEASNLASALTATYWEDRLLGTSDSARFPVRCAWIATGNNPSLSSEIARRTIRIRLDARADRPWLRTDFKHTDLRDWARGQRGNLASAALTLGAAWLNEGKPIAPDAPKLGMYESWSRVIGGILGTAGIPGFLANLSEFYDRTDTEGQSLRQFIAIWWDTFSVRQVGVADLFKVVNDGGIDLDLGEKSERGQRIRLGRVLGDLRDRHFALPDGKRVRITDAGTRYRAQQWQLVPASDIGEDGEHVNM